MQPTTVAALAPLNVKDILETLAPGETAAKLEGNKLIIERRNLLPEAPRAPMKAESPARSHVFHTAKSFADYLAKYGSDDTVVYADQTEEVIHAILDEKAGKGFELVTMQPQPHPLWTPWEQLIEGEESQEIKEFAGFINEHRRSIVNGRNLALTLAQIKCAVEIEAQHGRGKTSLNGIMVKTKLMGVQNEQEVELPEEIVVEVPLYVGTDKKAITLDLMIEGGTGGGVYARVTAGAAVEARVAAFDEMVATIRKTLADQGKSATLTFGAPSHVDWKYLPEMQAK